MSRCDEDRVVRALSAKLAQQGPPDFTDDPTEELLRSGRHISQRRQDHLTEAMKDAVALAELAVYLHTHRGVSWPQMEREFGESHTNLRRWIRAYLEGQQP